MFIGALVKVISLVVELKGEIVLVFKSAAVPTFGVALKDVPSSTVPNLLPKIVVNKVLTIEKKGSSIVPVIAPVIGVDIRAFNLDSTFMVVNELVPPMAEAREGRVVIFSACLGRMSGPGNAGGLAPYRISKAGVNALVRNLAHETGMGARGLLVDAICPNHSRTDMGGPDALRSAEEGAETALWLLSRTFNPQSENEIEKTTGVLWEDHQIVPW